MEMQANAEKRDPDVYVGNLSFQTEEGEIQEIFSKYGQVKYVKMHRSNGEFRGVAFVGMGTREESVAAIDALNGTTQRGRKIKVSFAESRYWSNKAEASRRDQFDEHEHFGRPYHGREPTTEERYGGERRELHPMERRDPPMDRRDFPPERREHVLERGELPMDRRDPPAYERRDPMPSERREPPPYERREPPPYDVRNIPMDRREVIVGRKEYPTGVRELQMDRRDPPYEIRDVPMKRESYPADGYPHDNYAQSRYPPERRELPLERDIHSRVPQDRAVSSEVYLQDRYPPERSKVPYQHSVHIPDDRYRVNQRLDERDLYQRREAVADPVMPLREAGIQDIYRTESDQRDPRYRGEIIRTGSHDLRPPY